MRRVHVENSRVDSFVQTDVSPQKNLTPLSSPLRIRGESGGSLGRHSQQHKSRSRNLEHILIALAGALMLASLWSCKEDTEDGKTKRISILEAPDAVLANRDSF
jgi:hypothetical protein